MKHEVCDFDLEFFNIASLSKAVTTPFLALIPKIDHPHTLSKYRLISLIRSMYKIVSKLLGLRLKVLGRVISSCQSAFSPSTRILDGVLVVNEVTDLVKRRKYSCFLHKIGFEKAHDSVNWKFLGYMLGKLGFSTTWGKWINACICSSSVSVLRILMLKGG